MEKKLLRLKFDVIFKSRFSDIWKLEILIDFLRSMLVLPDDEYESVELADP